jgi:hypothetical protein
VHLATRRGQGIAFLSLVEVFDDLRAGHLVQVLSDFPSPGLPVYLAYPSRRHLAPRTRLVMDFILETFRENEALLATIGLPCPTRALKLRAGIQHIRAWDSREDAGLASCLAFCVVAGHSVVDGCSRPDFGMRPLRAAKRVFRD